MKTNMQDARTRFRIAAALLAGAFVMPNHTWAQQTSPVKPPHIAVEVPAATAPEAAAEETAASKKSGGDGIKIHGHWVIDIKNPDGTVAKHLDFENSLTTEPATGSYSGSTGDQLLAVLLSGMGAPSTPAIGLIQAPSPGTSIPSNQDLSTLCNRNFSSGYACGMLTIAQSLTTSTSFYDPVSMQTGLTSTVSFTSPVNWVLSGNFTVPATGFTSLTAVQTLLPICMATTTYENQSYSYLPLHGAGAVTPTTVAASTCTLANLQASKLDPSFGPLTQTVVPGAPVAVAPNQILTITVTLSFS